MQHFLFEEDICLSRMGEGRDLLITSIDELKQVYGKEVWIKN